MSLFEREINDKIRGISDNILLGNMMHDDYKKACGRIQGLTEALEIYKDLVKKLYKEEDYLE